MCALLEGARPLFVFMPPQHDNSREWARRLSKDVPELEVVAPESFEEAARLLPQAVAAFGTIPRELLALAPNLKWLQAPAAAPPAGYYYQELVEHPVIVTNFRGIYNEHVATHAMAFVLAFARGFHRYIPLQLKHRWQPEPEHSGVVYLPEATALVIGVGGIGAEIARLCAAFGMRVVGVDARRQDMPPGVTRLHPPDVLDSLLSTADFVIMTVPHTPETEGMIHIKRLQLMKPSAFLINVGRGKTVVLKDLIKALHEGIIAGAGLDVFEEEPLPPDHPLWTTPNLLLTPHVAANGPYLNERRYSIILENARRFVSGRELINVVDKSKWY
ncbi:D-isomer specific 2-hydroxyacid dehydrogenase NAD-binding protein [Thermobaculum terrenum ATCC BAA-798]|uniref:D-isomer specific 2-hydroxyacid dehydrogenase NAD-binding protein n=1 Tax=Thermobaculum terrenum (strain ATCC BAA-798 / CCMEE 7001 / YNP1) TaxID=525904 RepID=D1CBS0_THET1|nr:D-2-hydroxyacid dehydrogenase [Thermobaculum terrenum]ACZ42235.1 D-isomer specific 2-hydroxyacid dehydrogenase NAD-binding protein [Thermobaculum terrenum ATCC BAA-798]